MANNNLKHEYGLCHNNAKFWLPGALPYANGPLHLGHLVEHIQTDIWARLHKMQGHTCIAICGEDAHGTPIMIKAEKRGYQR